MGERNKEIALSSMVGPHSNSQRLGQNNKADLRKLAPSARLHPVKTGSLLWPLNLNTGTLTLLGTSSLLAFRLLMFPTDLRWACARSAGLP